MDKNSCNNLDKNICNDFDKNIWHNFDKNICNNYDKNKCNKGVTAQILGSTFNFEWVELTGYLYMNCEIQI